MITELQKRTAQAVVKIFETGKPLGDYGAVTVIPGDTGHLSYGTSQASLTSGNLGALIAAYCDAKGLYAPRLASWLPAMKAKDTRLDHDQPLKNLLKEAGSDPIMRRVQDAFFDQRFWQPTAATAENMGIRSPLGMLTLYDSAIHGSLKLIADRTTQQHGASMTIGEEVWISRYIATRRSWLANHTNTLLRKTVYRMDELDRLARAGNWLLLLPLKVRSVEITENIFMAAPPSVSSAESTDKPAFVAADRRTLRLTSPVMQGEDVRDLQTLLNLAGCQPPLQADGVCGQKTIDAVMAFQKSHNMKPDGIVGPQTWKTLDKYGKR